ncbi:hypothetical protein Gotri_005593, partial [Gossypium trilobum]|nr:hypothetical protein [Gossypium trilobum]
TQHEKGDCLAEGYVFELWDFTRISVTRNSLQELNEIWDQWNDEFWNTTYNCFTFGKVDLVPTKNLKDIILAHPDTNKKVDVFALSIYGLVVFPKALGHVDEAVTNLAGEGRFIGCAQLLLAWFHSYFWKVDKVSYRVFSENYSPLKEIVATPRRDDISEEKWVAIIQNLEEEDVEWRAPWFLPDEILY